MNQSKGRFLLWFTLLFLCLQILATVLAIYGQRIAHFLSGHVEGLHVAVALFIITVLCIGTFLATYMIILKAEKKRPELNFFFYLMVNGLYGFLVSLFGIFILAMFWG